MPTSPQIALLLVRVGFGVFLMVWGLNKIVNPGATVGIFASWYGVEGLTAVASAVLGIAQVTLSLAIIAGLLKTLTYGLGALLHAGSTLATTSHLLLPFAEGSNLFFMAGLPVLTAAIGLFLARREDTLLSLDEYLKRSRLSFAR